MKTTEVLVNFFKNIPHNCRRVADWYNPNMEVQINVHAHGGIMESPGVYSDDKQPFKWYNIRIPKNAKTEPIDNDSPLAYPLDLYGDAIGMTGWDWKNKQSIRFGFDYDAVVGHAAGVGVTDHELERVKQITLCIPEILVLRSTSGSGLHLYLECDPDNLPTTTTHTEHAALALAALHDISQRVGFDFHTHLDVGGGNMWVWARKMTTENQGLTIEKDNVDKNGDKAYYTPPENWRNFLEIVSGKRNKPRVQGAGQEDQKLIDENDKSKDRITLDSIHKKLIEDLHTLCPTATTSWLGDQGLLQTHTSALKTVFDKGTYTGVFNTLSEGKDLTKPNCFGYPKTNGRWNFIRFGKGTNEASSWQTSDEGWTMCFFNEAVSMDIVAQIYQGVEDTKKGYVFSTSDIAIQAAKSLGSSIKIPDELTDRAITLRTHTDGRLLVEVIKARGDTDTITGWLKKANVWYKLYGDIVSSRQADQGDLPTIDKLTRSLITPGHDPYGWAIKHVDGYWIKTAKDDAKTIIAGSPLAKVVSSAMATALTNSWVVVNLPFQPEYPGKRQWNLDGAQFAYKPADLQEDETPHHPSWDLILNHCGQDLTENLQDMPWAIENNILTGRDYLLTWIASMVRQPFQALPYLFLYSLEQDTGKSTLHEALELLFTKGVAKADTALTSKGDFNGELDGAILCVVEEKNISLHREAYSKLKDWVCSLTLGIHKKHKQVFSARNTCHWIHTANEKQACPIFPGDTRIISIYVPMFTGEEIPKVTLINRLKKEAPHFLVTLNRQILPEPYGRLFLPLVITSSKSQLAEVNRNPLEEFIDEKCFYIPGEKLAFKIFQAKFQATLTDTEQSNWSIRNIVAELKNCFPFGSDKDGVKIIGNMSFAPPADDKESEEHYIRQGNNVISVKKLT